MIRGRTGPLHFSPVTGPAFPFGGEDTMRSIRIVLAVLVAATALGAAGCEQKGPAEQAGEKIDKAAEKGADAVATAAGNVKEAVDK